jgi:hypothetical protein
MLAGRSNNCFLRPAPSNCHPVDGDYAAHPGRHQQQHIKHTLIAQHAIACMHLLVPIHSLQSPNRLHSSQSPSCNSYLADMGKRVQHLACKATQIKEKRLLLKAHHLKTQHRHHHHVTQHRAALLPTVPHYSTEAAAVAAGSEPVRMCIHYEVTQHCASQLASQPRSNASVCIYIREA